MTDLQDMYLDATAPAHGPRIAITIYGTPIPQGSKVANRYGNGVRDANAAKLTPWRKQVRDEAEDVWRYRDTIRGPVRLWARFSFTRPKSHYRTGRNAALVMDNAPTHPGRLEGDLDKLVRAVCDALTDAQVWTDDTLLVDLRARKFFAGEHEYALPKAGAQLIVEPLTPGGLW